MGSSTLILVIKICFYLCNNTLSKPWFAHHLQIIFLNVPSPAPFPKNLNIFRTLHYSEVCLYIFCLSTAKEGCCTLVLSKPWLQQNLPRNEAHLSSVYEMKWHYRMQFYSVVEWKRHSVSLGKKKVKQKKRILCISVLSGLLYLTIIIIIQVICTAPSFLRALAIRSK